MHGKPEGWRRIKITENRWGDGWMEINKSKFGGCCFGQTCWKKNSQGGYDGDGNLVTTTVESQMIIPSPQ